MSLAVRVLSLVVITLALLPLTACDREAANPPPTTRPADPVLELHLKPLTPLLPNRPTHMTADPQGNKYWVQEADRADDTVFVIDDSGIPRATALSAANIALALEAPGGRGNIHGIAAGTRGEIYFYFQGTHERRTIAALGQFQPRSSQIRVLANTEAVADATGMGRSLPLARGTVIGDGQNIWLYLRHSDIWAIFRFEPAALPAEGPILLAKAFDAVTLDGRPVRMTRESLDLSPAGEGRLFLLDLAEARLLRVAPDGAAKVERSLVGLPSVLSTPVVDEKGRLLIFAANAPLLPSARPAPPAGSGPPTRPVAAAAAAVAAAPRIDATFPSLLIFQPDGEVKSIGRDHISVYPGFPVFGIRLTRLVAQPKAAAWLTYDSNSGEFLLLSLRQRGW